VQRAALLEEVASLLQKQAIAPINPPYVEGFWSTFFLAPKKTGDWRPILNLKPLNKFIVPQRFRMETLASVLRCPIKNKWAASLDLKDAYLHVPIAPQDQKWLRFQIKGQGYKFLCLPFGLSTAPRVFTMVVRSVGAYLKRRGVSLCQYLDDWLIYGNSEKETSRSIKFVVDTVTELGFIVNYKKSSLTPTQTPIFLGARLDLAKGRATPTMERVTNLVQCARILAGANTAPAVAWLKVLGLMASMVDLVPYCRYHMRALQIHLLAHFTPSRHSLSRLVPVTVFVRQELQWWYHQPNLLVGVTFPSPKTDLVITTDASNTGWGGHLVERQASGLWSVEEAQSHINLLELWAVERTLSRFEQQVTGRNILVQSDNSTVVAYINKQGGTRSPVLCANTLRILKWCQVRNITVRALHIAGVTNILADNLSRGRISSPSEWSLAPQVALTIFSRFYQPLIDLFASSQNRQLPVYCSRVMDPRAYAVDALLMDWTGMAAYAFPPISLLPRVIEKIAQEDCNVILVAPFWPKHLWFRPLVDLLADRPRLLPEIPDLLRGPGGLGLGLPTEHLKLTAWPLSGNVAAREAFHKDLLLLSPQVGDPQRSELILSVWVHTTSGAEREISLHLEPL